MNLFIITFLILCVSSCGLKRPGATSPTPDKFSFEKNIFTNPDGTKKSYMAGWASESSNGTYGKSWILHNYNMAMHCNLVFDVREQYLVGLQIDPSYPNDQSRWKEVLTIPILKHYYLEKGKDNYNRETNEIVENSSRSYWKNRTHIKLDFSGIKILEEEFKIFWGHDSTIITGVEDEEVTEENGKTFIAFTASITSSFFGSEMQGKFRFNFLEYKHDHQFKKIKYDENNAKKINPIFIMGKKVDGLNQILHVARWDLENNNLPIKLYARNFPDEYKSIVEDVVKEWNVTFTKVFMPEIKDIYQNYTEYFALEFIDRKYAFDLRYPTINWVSDREISEHGPLGIAMTHADVLNGKIQWGAVNIFGGTIEGYLDHYYPLNSGKEENQYKINNLQMVPRFPITKKQLMRLIGENNQVPKGFNNNFDISGMKLEKFKNKIGDSLNLSSLLSKQEKENYVLNVINEIFGEARNEQEKYAQKIIDITNSVQDRQDKILGYNLSNKKSTETSELTKEEKMQIALSPYASHIERGSVLQNNGVFDLDRRFSDVIGGWQEGLKEQGIEHYPEALRAMLKGLILHEMGHMFGLGHQFKENILPAQGTVPDKYLFGDEHSHHNHLKEGLVKRSTKESGYTNYTSVMGYRHPKSEVLTDYDDLIPGPQDYLTLMYIYRNKYPIYQQGQNDFEFLDVSSGGKIPNTAAYFPACNDLEASLYADPYCNRHDRGNKASEIMASYFDGIINNLDTKLFSFTDQAGGNPEAKEMYLWQQSLLNLSRIRIFYDYMRQKYSKQIAEIVAKDEQNFMEFYDTCSGKINHNSKLNNLFNHYEELKELCIANGQAINELTLLMSLDAADYSKYDRDKYMMPAGMSALDVNRDYGRFFGTWKELTAIPIKTSALYYLTTTSPSMLYNMEFAPIPKYSDSESHYSYATLYPVEYTKSLHAAVNENIKLPSENDENQRTIVGRLIHSIGGFAFMNQSTNDQNLGKAERILEKIRNQVGFQVSLGMVILKEHKFDGKTQSKKVSHFTAGLYDLSTQRMTGTQSVHILPGKKLLVRGLDGTFIIPTGSPEIKFFGENKDSSGLAYSYVIKVEFDDERDDLLSKYSLKFALKSLHNKVMDECIHKGPGNEMNGLDYFFNENGEGFEGFEYNSNIGGNPLSQDKFFESVEKQYKIYYTKGIEGKKLPSPDTCAKAVQGLKAIVTTSGLLQGMVLPTLLQVQEIE